MVGHGGLSDDGFVLFIDFQLRTDIQAPQVFQHIDQRFRVGRRQTISLHAVDVVKQRVGRIGSHIE